MEFSKSRKDSNVSIKGEIGKSVLTSFELQSIQHIVKAIKYYSSDVALDDVVVNTEIKGRNYNHLE